MKIFLDTAKLDGVCHAVSIDIILAAAVREVVP